VVEVGEIMEEFKDHWCFYLEYQIWKSNPITMSRICHDFKRWRADLSGLLVSFCDFLLRKLPLKMTKRRWLILKYKETVIRAKENSEKKYLCEVGIVVA